MSTQRLVAATGLGVLLAATVLLDAPDRVRTVILIAAVVAGPGLLLTAVLELGDVLLSSVVGVLVGPAAWYALRPLGDPSDVVLVAGAGALALVSLAFLGLRFRSSRTNLDDGRHRFRPHRSTEVVARPSGRHRGAFPSPYDEVKRP